ncbi:hypothetical protein FOMPIDRAFT_93246 [Fomitopsis schrenkii]|uniref:F-box domain-containing protein n=1 Tax=Fomitopsis schrenkii TaxID=2126942 RepID=S8FC36_FOMSC|nr:hypothetical protein FOMPIDRAFT_93246 [Fomitopsis schrenkii]
MSNVHNAGPPQSFDLAPIRDFMERHQQGTIRFQELLVHNGDWLGEQMPTLLSVLSESPFEMRLKRLGWTTISRAGRSTNWEVLCPQMERIFRLSQPRLEYLHLGVDTDDAWLERFDLSACNNLKVLALSFAHEHSNDWPHVPLFLSSVTSTALVTIGLTVNLFRCNSLFSQEFFDWRRLNDALLSVHKRRPLAALSVDFRFIIYHGEPPDVHEPLQTRLAPVLEAGMQVNISSHAYSSRIPHSFPP